MVILMHIITMASVILHTVRIGTSYTDWGWGQSAKMGNVKWFSLMWYRARRAWWPGRSAARDTLGRAADAAAALRQRGARGEGCGGQAGGAPRTTASSKRPSSPGSAGKREISSPATLRSPHPARPTIAYSSSFSVETHYLGVIC